MSINHDDFSKLPNLLRQGGKSAEQAAGRLYDTLWRPLVRFFVRHRLDEGMSEDLASETKTKAVLQIHSLRDDAAFLGWIWQIARNELSGHLRDTRLVQQSEAGFDEEAWQLLLETQADHSHGDRVVQLCLQGQLERFRQDHPERAYCIEQAVLEGRDGQALSAVLGRSYGATREYLSQCRKKIAEYLRLCLEPGQRSPLA